MNHLPILIGFACVISIVIIYFIALCVRIRSNKNNLTNYSLSL